MTYFSRSLVLFSFLLLSPVYVSHAAENAEVVWLADGVSLQGVRQVMLYPVTNSADKKHDEIIALISGKIKETLTKSGISVTDIDAETAPTQLAIKTTLIRYKKGDVGQRWMMYGGASACILRSRLYQDSSMKAIGDIIIVKQVAGGGLFSAGAEKYVPKNAGEETANQLLILMGLKPKETDLNEEEEEF